MKKKWQIAAIAVLCAVSAGAGDDVDVKLNGDFRGAITGAAGVPGWTISAGDGASRVVPGGDSDEFGLELAAGKVVKSAYTALIPVRGKYLEVEAEVRGNGKGAIIVSAFDAKGASLGREARFTIDPLSRRKVKFVCKTAEAAAAFIRITLSADPGAVLTYEEVEAEFKNGFVMAASELRTVAAAAAEVAAPAVPPQPEIADDAFYRLASLAEKAEFQLSLPVGEDIEFKVEEDTGKKHFWSAAACNTTCARIEVKHERDGFWPFRVDSAEIEIKAVAKGREKLVFSYPGRSIIIHLNAY